MRQWVLSLPIPLRLLLAAQPRLVTPVLQVVHRVITRHLLLSGGIRSGQFISQRELMTLLDMPLGAVREMIPRLEAGGLIRTVPQRGLQIAHVDLKLIRNAFQVRAMIEREAILHYVRSASVEELEAIEASHRDILRRASAERVDAGLLDELFVQVASVTLGRGKPLLPRRITALALRLRSVRAVGTAFAELHYEVVRATDLGAAG